MPRLVIRGFVSVWVLWKSPDRCTPAHVLVHKALVNRGYFAEGQFALHGTKWMKGEFLERRWDFFLN